MRESEEYLEANKYPDASYGYEEYVDIIDAEHAVKLAYKEGRESMHKDIIDKLKELETINWYNTYKNIIANLEDLGKDS